MHFFIWKGKKDKGCKTTMWKIMVINEITKCILIFLHDFLLFEIENSEISLPINSLRCVIYYRNINIDTFTCIINIEYIKLYPANTLSIISCCDSDLHEMSITEFN